MEDFPSNSHDPRPNSRVKAAPVTKEQKPSVERVVTGKVIVKKRSLGRRFLDTFGGGDARGVVDYILLEVLVPAAKDAIADATSQGVERMVFGEVRSSNRRRTRYGSPSSSQTGYTRYSSPTSNTSYGRTEREPARSSYRHRGGNDIKEIILATRIEAEEVLTSMENIVERYGSISVWDLYDLLGITGEYTDQKWGWLELKNLGVTRVRDGYSLDLPRPESLD